MKLTINTDVLKKYHLSLGDFIVLLASFYNLDCEKINNELIAMGLAEKDLFKGFPPILSDNTKNLISKIIVQSDDKVVNSKINFDKLAVTMQTCYPEGIKSGTTYEWRGTKDEITQKLMTLVSKYNFTFTEEEAVAAVKEYVGSFKDYKYMSLLKNFVLTVRKDNLGHYEMESMFMTIIENNREQNENSN